MPPCHTCFYIHFEPLSYIVFFLLVYIWILIFVFFFIYSYFLFLIIYCQVNLNQTKNRLVFTYYQKPFWFDQVTEVTGPLKQRRQQLNSPVISATWNGKEIRNLQENITTLFKPLTVRTAFDKHLMSFKCSMSWMSFLWFELLFGLKFSPDLKWDSYIGSIAKDTITVKYKIHC